MNTLYTLLTFLCAILGVHFILSAFDLYDRYVLKGLIYGVASFCAMLVFGIIASCQGV